MVLSPTYRASHGLSVLPTRVFSARGTYQPRLHVRLDQRHVPTLDYPCRGLTPANKLLETVVEETAFSDEERVTVDGQDSSDTNCFIRLSRRGGGGGFAISEQYLVVGRVCGCDTGVEDLSAQDAGED